MLKMQLKINLIILLLVLLIKSKTKKTKFRASLNDLKKFRILTNKPIVAIGGINKDNYKNLLLNKADFLAISSFIWKNKKLKPVEAIKILK